MATAAPDSILTAVNGVCFRYSLTRRTDLRAPCEHSGAKNARRGRKEGRDSNKVRNPPLSFTLSGGVHSQTRPNADCSKHGSCGSIRRCSRWLAPSCCRRRVRCGPVPPLHPLLPPPLCFSARRSCAPAILAAGHSHCDASCIRAAKPLPIRLAPAQQCCVPLLRASCFPTCLHSLRLRPAARPHTVCTPSRRQREGEQWGRADSARASSRGAQIARERAAGRADGVRARRRREGVQTV